MTKSTSDDLSQMAHPPRKSGGYRVPRRLVPRDGIYAGSRQTSDVETTGLDTKADEVIELDMVKFAYCADGRVAHVIDNFGSSVRGRAANS